MKRFINTWKYNIQYGDEIYMGPWGHIIMSVKCRDVIEIIVTHRRRIFSEALENVAQKFVSNKSAVVQPNFV